MDSQEQRANAAYLDSISRLGSALATTHLPATIVEHVGKELEEMFAPQSFLIVTNDPSANALKLALAQGIESPSIHDPRLKKVLTENSVLAPPPGGWMGTQILAAGLRYGAICVFPEPESPYAGSDLAALGSVASLLGLALQGASLYERLSAGKRDWEHAVDAIPQAFCIIDKGGRVRRGNLAFSELVARPVTTFADRRWTELVPSEWVESIGRVLALSVKERLRSDDRLFDVSALPIKRPGTDVTLLIFEDVTAKEELQDQLAQSAKMTALGHLISGVAHDLNNPLTSVIGFADYLTSGNVAIPDHLKEPLASIRQETERAANIVKQLLSFARKQDRSRNVQAIRQVLESTLLLMKNQLISSRVDATLEIEDRLPPVLINFGQIQQVFVNLLNNASQAITASGVGYQISITAVRSKHDVAVVVKDNGPGIESIHSERIFEPFFTTKQDQEGTGLGLSICQGILSEHGGSIGFEPNPDGGAMFRVLLPAASSPEEVFDEAIPEIPSQRILVVDDEPHILHYIKATLEAWGHTVEVAGDNGEAVAILADFDAEMVISDLRMPSISGYHLFRLLEKTQASLASSMIFMTADTMTPDTEKFLEQTRQPRLDKPFTLQQLQSALAQVVANRNGK